MKNKNPDQPGVIARPPQIYLVFILAGVFVNRIWPIKMDWENGRLAVGLILLGVGLGLMVIGMLQMKKAGTPVNPRETPTALLTTGLFRYSRNPLYISISVIYFGIAVLLQNGWIVIFFVPLMIFMHYGVIVREEKYLERKFGGAYLGYKKSVRRWI